MTQHIAYIRVSTDKQTEGLEAQRHAIQQWAQGKGVEIDEWFSETVSGAAPMRKRIALLQAVSSLRRGGVLVMYRRDRLSRDALKAALLTREIEDAGASIIAVNGAAQRTTPEGRLICHILDGVAEYEREMAQARTLAAVESKRARGEYLGGRAPYGWKRYSKTSPKLVKDRAEQSAIKRMRQLREEGVSFQKITKTLRDEGYPCRGKSWHTTTVVRVLKAAGDTP